MRFWGKFVNIFVTVAPFLICIAAPAQIKLSPSSATITGNAGPPPSIAGNSPPAPFTVQGLPKGTTVQAHVAYPLNGNTNWLNASISGNAITVTTTSSSDSLGQGTYAAYLYVQVGTVTLPPATITLQVFPQDNQFLFFDTGGNGIFDGVSLSTSSAQQTIWITYGGDFTSSASHDFYLTGPDWLSVTPISGNTPQKGIVLHALPQPASSTKYEGYLYVTSTNAPTKTAALPIHYLAEGSPSGQDLATGVLSFVYGSAGIFNGESGFTYQAQASAGSLTIAASSTQPIRILGRFGTDVDPTAPNAVDVQSDTSLGPSLTIGPPVQAGKWYFAIRTTTGSLTTGYIQATIQAAAPCTYSLSAPPSSVGPGQGSGTVTLTTGPACGWTVSSDANWLTVTTSASGTGPAVVGYQYSANTGPRRSATLTIAGQPYTINQDAAPVNLPQIQSFTANPSSIKFGDSSTLSWAVNGASQVSIDQGIGAVASSGTQTVSPLSSTTYTLSATNSAGTNTARAVVTVAGQPPNGRKILTATPNPILLAANTATGKTALNWTAPSGVTSVELHVNAPDGPTMVGGGATGSASTDNWVSDGMTFFLQDVTAGKPLTVANTLDTVTVRAVPSNQLFFSGSPLYVPPGAASGTVLLTWNAPAATSVQIWVSSASGVQMTGSLPPSGFAFSGDWATPGTTFYLQDSSTGDGKGDSKTLATFKVGSPATQPVTPPPVTSGGVSFYANPNPITPEPGATSGKTTLFWSSPDPSQVEIFVNAPDGIQMTGALPNQGSADTGNWVTDGMQFFLQKAVNGSAAGAANTLAQLTVHVGNAGSAATLDSPVIPETSGSRIQWSRVKDANRYEVLIDHWTAGKWCSEVSGCAVDRIETDALDTPLPEGTTAYRLRVRASGPDHAVSSWTSWIYSSATAERGDSEFKPKH